MNSVCIVGGGPAGMMLARAGVQVTVLEKHKDFFRDFRGDTIHPSTLELLKGRTAEIDSFDKLKLLTIQVNHLQQWAMPGLLCIGDAAHAMSPVGGIGINIALQDAVATANILTDGLLASTTTVHDLAQVQHYRQAAVRNTQQFQIAAHYMLSKAVLGNPEALKPPVVLRVLTRIPGFQRMVGRFIGMGLQPQHIGTECSIPVGTS